MKKILFIAVLLVGGMTWLKAENGSNYGFKPILETGKWWVWSVAPDANAEIVGYDTITVVRDTIVDGKPAFVTESSSINTETLVFENKVERSKSSSIFAEQDGVLYAYSADPQGNMRFYPWIDMNLCNGETINYLSYDDDLTYSGGVVYNDEIIVVNGIERKKITLQPGSVWVEGIGSNNSDYLTIYPVPVSLGYVASRFIGCYLDDECIFTAEDFNTSAGIESVENDRFDDETVFDLQGRRVEKPLRGHIYIRGGRIIVW